MGAALAMFDPLSFVIAPVGYCAGDVGRVEGV
jgi:hypothetical protein